MCTLDRSRLCIIAAVGLFAAAAVRADSPTIVPPPPPPGSAVEAAEGTSKLAWELVRASGEGNAILSPASVWEALAMTHAGARGETAAEIAAVLGVSDDREQIAAAAAELRTLLAEAKGEKIKLDVANRIWAQQGKRLEADFTGLLENKYGAVAGIVDFASRPEDARREINAWVGEHTADKIPELLKSDTITPLTRLVLTNAIYMKAPWAKPFEKSATRPEGFTLAGGDKAEVPFMHASGKMVAGKLGDGGTAATVCEIPYAGDRLAMVLVVPAKADGLPAVLVGLAGDWRAQWNAAGGVRQRPVILSLPKWTARKPLSLTAALQSLGMKQAFVAGRADLSGMDGTKDLFVSDVVHEGFVEVSEEGTEAAAATGVIVATRAAVIPEEPLEVKADRPFAWAVVEPGTGAVLFAGTVTDPR
ncbi:MAG: serpin family protein [Planctomycetota bacterium]